jgi:2-polyprenyl-6-hydroxyphenyl methylase/3-demethylubiquinone-9 3-methyltransferase
MRESDIRPSHLSVKQKDAYQLDLARYKKHISEFIFRNCPGCGDDNSNHFLDHDVFRFVRCMGCQCVFMNPGPTDDHVADLYENSEIYKFWAEFMYPQSRDSRLATLHKSRVEWLSNAIDEFLPPKSKYRILEVGAGTGDTLFKLNSLNRSDLNTFAVEWNPDMKESLDKNGVEFLGRTIEEIRQDSQKFDVIVLFEVIEHLLDPNLFLESATKLLDKHGLIMFTTPNAQSLEVQWMKNRTMTIDIEHISLLTPAAVTHLAYRNSLIVKKIETSGKLDREIMENAGLELRVFFDKNESTKESIQEIIASGGFSSNMQVVLQN